MRYLLSGLGSRARVLTTIVALACLAGLSCRGSSDSEAARVGDVQGPVRIRQVTPEYPEEARRAGVEGTVALSGIIDADGNVKDVAVVTSIPLLDQAAIDAFKQFKYKPATKGGRPISVRFTVTLDFKWK